MAVERFTGSQTDAKPSTVDLRGKEFRFLKAVAGGFAVADLGELAVGTCSEGKDVGLHSSVKTGNQLKVLAGANIAVGNKVASDANGAARVAAATHHVLGVAKSAGAAGELVTIEFNPQGILA